MNERCPLCGQGTIAERLVQRVFTTAMHHVIYQNKAMLCDRCGWGGLTAEQVAWNEQQRLAATAPETASGVERST